MSNEAQARESVESFPIQKATVDDIEIEYRVIDRKNSIGDVTQGATPFHCWLAHNHGYVATHNTERACSVKSKCHNIQ